MNLDLSQSLREALNTEISQFLDKIEKIYHQCHLESDLISRKRVYLGDEAFESILRVVAPQSPDENTNNVALSNFLQSTLNMESEKVLMPLFENLKKKYCANEIGEVSLSTRLFCSQDSAFAQHRTNKMDTFMSHNSVFSVVSPLSENSKSVIIPSIIGKSVKELSEGESFLQKSGIESYRKFSEGKKQYKVYSTELKMEIVDYALKHSIKEACEKYQISANKIAIWNRSILKTKQARGRKTVDPEMEEKVCKWLEKELEEGTILTQRIIRQKAKEISCLENFKASKGWLEKFFKRRPKLFKLYSENRNNTENIENFSFKKEEENEKEFSNESDNENLNDSEIENENESNLNQNENILEKWNDQKEQEEMSL